MAAAGPLLTLVMGTQGLVFDFGLQRPQTDAVQYKSAGRDGVRPFSFRLSARIRGQTHGSDPAPASGAGGAGFVVDHLGELAVDAEAARQGCQEGVLAGGVGVDGDARRCVDLGGLLG